NSTYLNLTGNGVTVGMTDSGVDFGLPDLSGRTVNVPAYFLGPPPLDPSGHGTFVATVLGGIGSSSAEVTNASPLTNALTCNGLNNPGLPSQYRGMAPNVLIFPQAAQFITPALPNGNSVLADTDLQTNYANAGVHIVNNSWNYASFGYDVGAA